MENSHNADISDSLSPSLLFLMVDAAAAAVSHRFSDALLDPSGAFMGRSQRRSSITASEASSEHAHTYRRRERERKKPQATPTTRRQDKAAVAAAAVWQHRRSEREKTKKPLERYLFHPSSRLASIYHGGGGAGWGWVGEGRGRGRGGA